MLPAGFETAIPASERPQTQALDRAATLYYRARNIYGQDGNGKWNFTRLN